VKALGANVAQIIWVFLGQGTIVGLFGTLTGLGLGMTLIRYRNVISVLKNDLVAWISRWTQ